MSRFINSFFKAAGSLDLGEVRILLKGSSQYITGCIRKYDLSTSMVVIGSDEDDLLTFISTDEIAAICTRNLPLKPEKLTDDMD